MILEWFNEYEFCPICGKRTASQAGSFKSPFDFIDGFSIKSNKLYLGDIIEIDLIDKKILKCPKSMIKVDETKWILYKFCRQSHFSSDLEISLDKNNVINIQQSLVSFSCQIKKDHYKISSFFDKKETIITIIWENGTTETKISKLLNFDYDDIKHIKQKINKILILS